MSNYKTDNTVRRYLAHVSVLGTTQIHPKNPYIVAWWSAAFPGFGHMLLSKYFRGFALSIWEVVINANARINTAMVYSFQGNFDLAKETLNTRWLLMYIPVYIFAIWDSYRTTVDLNKIYLLAEHENRQFNSFSIGALEINYLDKREPVLAFIWSFLMPGLGQLYIHRIVACLFIIVWSIIFFYNSHLLEAIHLLLQGDIQKSTSILEPQWFLFVPSMYFFVIYDAYINTVENNKLFEAEQKKYLKQHYQHPTFTIIKGKK